MSMNFLHLKTIVQEVESALGTSLDETGKSCVENAVEGYNSNLAGWAETKQSMREGAQALLMMGDNSLLRILDITEAVCDAKLRQGIIEAN